VRCYETTDRVGGSGLFVFQGSYCVWLWRLVMLQSHLSSSLKRIFLCWLCFCFLFAPFFRRITNFTRISGGWWQEGAVFMVIWYGVLSARVVDDPTGALWFLYLLLCTVQHLHSQQIGGFYSFWSMYSISLVSGFFIYLFIYLFSYLLIYFLPFSRISVCLSAFGVPSAREAPGHRRIRFSLPSLA